MAESDLYAPVKRLLETQGYCVKSEIHACDVVGVRGAEPPVVVELKQGLTLQLFYQAIDRLALTDTVYVAVPKPKRGVAGDAMKLCRRIGIGLITVSSSGSTDILIDPAPYSPRINTKRRGQLLKEFAKRQGDPNVGGVRGKIVTAYRQDAIKCADHLKKNGPSRLRDIRAATGVERAANILRDNYYGWFVKEDRGVYGVVVK